LTGMTSRRRVALSAIRLFSFSLYKNLTAEFSSKWPKRRSGFFYAQFRLALDGEIASCRYRLPVVCLAESRRKKK
jgi:hypothetical protein